VKPAGRAGAGTSGRGRRPSFGLLERCLYGLAAGTLISLGFTILHYLDS